MLCKNPYVFSDSAYGCGQCLPCLLNRRRLWTHRLILESFFHKHTSFVTLTYSDECLPAGGTLAPRDVQLWLKRLRKALHPRKVRYFLVGEYGEKGQRPHYHVALFGHSGCQFFPLASQKAERRDCKCPDCSLIRDTWENGVTDNNHLNLESAQYVCGYVTKKMTHKQDKCTERCTHPPLNGRHPEFARQSRKPGIGAGAIEDLANFVLSDVGANDLISTGDVPRALRHGGKKMPLGRYLRRKIRESAGFKEIGGQKEVLEAYKKEMYQLFKDTLGVEKLSANPLVRDAQIKAALEKINGQKIRSMEARHKIFSQKGEL